MTEPQGSLKIAVAIASRGRPAALAGVVMAAQRLQSGKHSIAFPLAVDDDDVRTIQMLDYLKDEAMVVPILAPRQPTLGAAQNRAIQSATDADITTLLTDRTFIITPGWDIGIVEAAIKYPNRILWWSCPSDPDTTIPIIPHTILDRTNHKWSPEIFAFWFDDTWNMEIDRMCFGGPSLRVRPMYSGARQQTQRGRDFRFWAELFVETRPLRLVAAKELNAALGMEWKDPPAEMIADFVARDKHLLEHADDFERMFGDPRPAGPEYAEAKAKAEALMKELVSA